MLIRTCRIALLTLCLGLTVQVLGAANDDLRQGPAARNAKSTSVAGHFQFQPNDMEKVYEESLDDSFDDSFGGKINCRWTCANGNTGSATTDTVQQCYAACEGACGGRCGPA
ncbi:MAG TPA: hypothetical protein VEL74_10785 [Thermoanaerobaculia bacterium]|nr:hypothetical protein [Thermoanaerobaculia bacterium]